MIVALNMMDEANSRDYHIDVECLSHLLGTPVVPMVANRDKGTNELLEEIIKVIENKVQVKELVINYGREAEEEITKLEKLISQNGELCRKYSPRWLAVKLLEGDEEIIKKFKEVKFG